MTYDELQASLRTLGLGERADLREIKARHRALVKDHHPDVSDEEDQSAIRQINEAYRVLLEYVSDYRFCFSEDEFYEQNPEERLRLQFMNDPLWGKS